MSAPSKQDFLNRLESFEKLLAEETFALRKGDFDYLNQLLENKRVALDELVSVKELAGIERGQDQVLDTRLDTAVNQQDINRRTIATIIADNLGEQKKAKTQSKQVREVCGTYTAAIASGKKRPYQSHFEA